MTARRRGVSLEALRDHYANDEFVLVDLRRVARATLAEVLEGAWRRLASQKMICEYEEGA
jgi:hypothetical protein